MDFSFGKTSDLLSSLGITIRDTDTTDPVMISQIMKQLNLDLASLSDNPSIKDILKRLSTEKIPLRPLKETILFGIKNNTPLYQVISESRGGISFHSSQMNFFINFTVILDVLTYLMINDVHFEDAIVNALIDKNSYRFRNSFFDFIGKLIGAKGNLFEAIKYASINPYMFELMVCRDHPPFPSKSELKSFIRKNHLSLFEGRVLKKKIKHLSNHDKNYGPLRANILEALVNEEMQLNNVNLFTSIFKNKDLNKPVENIKSGLALILYLEKNQDNFPGSEFKPGIFTLDPSSQSSYQDSHSTFWRDLYNFSSKNNYIKELSIINKEWMNLYMSWNAAFLLTSMPGKAHLVLPKLFIPTTLCCLPQYYISARTISLWLTLKFLISMRANNIQIDYETPNIDAFLKTLGHYNYLYAKTHVFNESIDELFQKRIHKKLPILNYLKAFRLLGS